MAELISRTSLFLGGACRNHRVDDDFSLSPVSFAGFGLKKSFSSLKQKPLRSDFHGKQIFLGDAQTESFRGSFRSSSITAQVNFMFLFLFFYFHFPRFYNPDMRDLNYKDLEN